MLPLRRRRRHRRRNLARPGSTFSKPCELEARACSCRFCCSWDRLRWWVWRAWTKCAVSNRNTWSRFCRRECSGNCARFQKLMRWAATAPARSTTGKPSLVPAAPAEVGRRQQLQHNKSSQMKELSKVVDVSRRRRQQGRQTPSRRHKQKDEDILQSGRERSGDLLLLRERDIAKAMATPDVGIQRLFVFVSVAAIWALFVGRLGVNKVHVPRHVSRSLGAVAANFALVNNLPLG